MWYYAINQTNTTMIPDPLHPAVVHLPIALAVLLPLLVLFALWLGRNADEVIPDKLRAIWLPVVLLAFILSASSFAAQETGEDQEERVEEVVSEDAIESHEERAELFVWMSGLLFIASIAGLVPGATGRYGRYVTLLLAVVVLVLGVRVGSTGGDLVYTHGAAQVYLESP